MGSEMCIRDRLDDDNKHVQTELKRLQIEADERADKGYNMQKHVEMATKAGIHPGSYPPPAMLAESRWFKTLTLQQKDTLSYSMVNQRGYHLFRDVRHGSRAQQAAHIWRAQPCRPEC